MGKRHTAVTLRLAQSDDSAPAQRGNQLEFPLSFMDCKPVGITLLLHKFDRLWVQSSDLKTENGDKENNIRMNYFPTENFLKDDIT